MQITSAAHRRYSSLLTRRWREADSNRRSLSQNEPVSLAERECRQRALALDPRSVEAQIGLALMLVSRVFDFWSDAPAVDVQHADQLIARVLAVSPNSAWAHYAKGQVLRAQLQYEDAAIEYETAIALDRNLSTLTPGLVGASSRSDRWTR
jgi:tetratricopeptide (TPR) repeat protein